MNFFVIFDIISILHSILTSTSRLFHWSRPTAPIATRQAMTLAHSVNKTMNKYLFKKSYPKRISCTYDWHQMEIASVLSNQLMVQPSPHFVCMNARNRLEWARCQDDSYCPATATEPFKCGISPLLWNLSRKRIQQVN